MNVTSNFPRVRDSPESKGPLSQQHHNKLEETITMWEEEDEPGAIPMKKKPPKPTKENGSQFAGASAMFRQKDSDAMKQQSASSKAVNSPRKESQFAGAAAMFNQRANSSMNNINYTPMKSSKKKVGVSSLEPPSFVSPGGANRGGTVSGWKSSSKTHTSSYLDKPSGFATPKSAKPKYSSVGVSPGALRGGGLHLSPETPTASTSTTGKSWKDKKGGGISFQAASPKPHKASVVPSFNSSYSGGSFLASPSPKVSKNSWSNNQSKLPESTPDIMIKVNPDIDKKIQARRAAARPPPKVNNDNVPEHVRKFRELEAARQAALNEKEYNAAVIVQKHFLGWKARAAYPALKKSNQERLRKMRKAEKLRKKQIQCAILIQKTFRGYMPREEFQRRITIKRRRDKNKKEIKRIKALIKNMPKKTKADIKEIKEEYKDRKKSMKKDMKKQRKEEDKKLEDVKKQGKDQIEFLKAENDKVREQQIAIKQETAILEKQFEVLMAKADETRRNFSSLQQWVNKKNQSIQKNEIASQKCRHRYLPNYRSEVAGRNKHCIAEYRIKSLYKKRLHRIVQEILEKSTDPQIVEDAHEALLQCEEELQSMPEIPVPEGLDNWLK